jgi:hypothetical protein
MSLLDDGMEIGIARTGFFLCYHRTDLPMELLRWGMKRGKMGLRTKTPSSLNITVHQNCPEPMTTPLPCMKVTIITL